MSGEAVTTAPAPLLHWVDYPEAGNGPFTGENAPAVLTRAGLAYRDLLAVGNLTFDSATGLKPRKKVVAANNGTNNGVVSRYVRFPGLAIPAAAQAAAYGARRLRHTFSALFWQTAGADSGSCEIGISGAGRMVTFGNSTPGVCVRAVGGGNWQSYYRQKGGDAPTIGADSGLSSTTPRLVSFIFTEGANPQLVVAVDGIALLTLTGAAQMLDASGGNLDDVPALYQSDTGSGVAGRSVYLTHCTWKIEAL